MQIAKSSVIFFIMLRTNVDVSKSKQWERTTEKSSWDVQYIKGLRIYFISSSV